MLAKMEKEGATLREISLPNIGYAVSSYYIIATAEASSNLSRFDGGSGNPHPRFCFQEALPTCCGQEQGKTPDTRGIQTQQAQA